MDATTVQLTQGFVSLGHVSFDSGYQVHFFYVFVHNVLNPSCLKLTLSAFCVEVSGHDTSNGPVG